MITYETTSQDGITYIKQRKVRVRNGHEFWLTRTIVITADGIYAPHWMYE